MRLVVCGGCDNSRVRADALPVSAGQTSRAPLKEGVLRIEPFRMERLQSTWENYVEYNLSESGVHPMRVSDLVPEAEGAGPLLSTELGYTQSNGTEELRDRIAAFYPGAAREQVLVTNGGSEANYTALWALLEKRDRVA